MNKTPVTTMRQGMRRLLRNAGTAVALAALAGTAAAVHAALRYLLLGLLGSMIDATEEKALEALKKTISDSRQRYLDSVAHSGTA